MKTLKSEEKKEDWLGTWGLYYHVIHKEPCGSEFSGLSFCLKYSRLVDKEAAIQKHQTAQANKQISTQQNSAISSHWTRKETSKTEDIKFLDNNCSTTAKCYRKTVAPSAIKG